MKGKTTVFLSPVAKKSGKVACKQRQEQIDGCRLEKMKIEKYSVWRLLEYAVLQCYGKEVWQRAEFTFDNGRWSTDEFFFSLSHGGGVVAVALSDKPVGVDVEAVCGRNFVKVAQRFFSEEQAKACLTEKDFLKIWVQKESAFKRGGEKTFLPSQTPCDGKTFSWNYGGTEYVVGVATQGEFEIVETEIE